MATRLAFPAPHAVQCQEFAVPALRPGEVRVRTLFSLMSTGTEGIAFTRSFDDGTHWAQYVRYPFVPGYAATGVVEDAGDGVDPALAGRVVFHGGPHASEHVLPASSCIAVPSDVEPGIAPWLA